MQQISILHYLIPRYQYISQVRGDIFSAILIGHLLDGEELVPSTQKAIDGVYKLIDLNKDNKDKNRGIPLEKYLGVL